MFSKTPKKRTHPEGKSPRGISISWKLFGYLALFTAFVLVVVWALQIGLLNYFYRETKLKELSITDNALHDAILEHPDELQETVERYSFDYQICTVIFEIDGKVARQIASSDVSGECLIHHMSSNYLTYLYEQAVAHGGVYTSPIGQIDAMHSQAMTEGSQSTSWRDHVFDRNPGERSVNTLHVRICSGTDGRDYIVMLDSRLEPLNATVQTLKTQFWMIAVILLLGALVLAFAISRNISQPIQKMNHAAKRLAHGQYDADFSVTGYREVIELSDSLTHASEELSRNDKLQKELIANVSHDLRTPLTMIIGYSEVMRDLPGENTPENVQVIIDETRRLADLVNDMLDLSKLQAGTRKLTLSRFSLTELTRSVMTRYEKLTQKDGYRIEYAFDTEVEVIADQTAILQVLYNLINNAVNYTGDSKLVRVTQEVIPDMHRVRISVTDDGAGIPPEEIPLIWDRYYKVDKVHRRAMIGTGLGLSIVKHILEQHQTSYGVESTLGEGSTFWFELPIE